MNGQAVNDLVGRLAQLPTPDQESVQQALGVPLRQTGENPYWRFYEFELAEGPFSGGEFRQSRDAEGALLSLTVAENSAPAESELDLGRWGQVARIEANPRIPPEGADTYIVDLSGARASFQFTHETRRLRSVALEWEEGDRPD